MKILFVGLGNLGSQVLDLFLLHTPGNHTFLVAGRNQEYLKERTNLSLFAATQLGVYPDITSTHMDVSNIDQSAQTISSFNPDLIFCALTTQRWLTIAELPKPIFERLLQAQPGPWLPLTLLPVYQLMQAVQQSGVDAQVINGSFPDTINAVLSKAGLAPTIGIGNLANTVPAVRRSIALHLKVPVERVEILFFGHHYVHHRLLSDGNIGGARFHLTALVNSEDLTHLLDMKSVFGLLSTTLHMREYTQLLTATSAMTILDMMINRTKNIVHAPGPNGLVGTYPLRRGETGIEVFFPQGLTLEEAIRINEDGQRLDGIEQIDNDGTVYFTERNMAILKEVLGYECRRMPLSEVEQWARELRAKYLELASTVSSQTG
ncbi:MAG TPA: hypothetical protein VEL31_29850 [Ktedonobacteraceae bacterium]|nr:hypothetical protein [Ktedonobacteraceae bacterium]